MSQLVKKDINLSDFPPSLRKLANYLIENVDYGSIKEACENLNLNTDATYVTIHKCKKRGLDVMDYVSDHWRSGFKKAKPLVRNSLVKGAINGSGKHQELFWKLSGDMVDKTETSVNIGLQFVFGGGAGIPSDVEKGYRERQKVIDISSETTEKS